MHSVMLVDNSAWSTKALLVTLITEVNIDPGLNHAWAVTPHIRGKHARTHAHTHACTHCTTNEYIAALVKGCLIKN